MPHQQAVISVQSADHHRFELIHLPAAMAQARLLFLPGMGVSARQYIDFGLALSACGIETYLHEWRGLGSSGLRAARNCDWGYRELLELDLAAAVDAIEACDKTLPLIVGGHSLGSQLACLLGAMRPQAVNALLIVAGGAPYFKAFSGWMRWGLPAVFLGMPTIAKLVGHYPGRRLGFAGREAKGVIRDWTHSGRSGIYAPIGVDHDLEGGMRALRVPVLGVRMADDWFVPQSSLDWLSAKLPAALHEQKVLKRESFSGPADHYRWMREPESTATAIVAWQAKYLA
ncbi:MAG: alpha/beta hydrolase family protein [Wenzhouxiangella sp.]